MQKLNVLILKKIRKSLSTKSEREILLPKLGWIVSFLTSDQSMQRALQILEVFTLIESRGHKIIWLDKEHLSLAINVFHEEFDIRIIEHIKHIRNEESDDYRKRWKYVPSGNLRFNSTPVIFSIFLIDFLVILLFIEKP